MKAVINGEPQELPEGITVAELIERLGLSGSRLAVEVNGAIVPKGEHERFVLSEGDRIEIVRAIGGG
ncbi:MAG: sulfur carrier protein ThiS [Gammaproteobacteria bacterium]|nr:MAG: sulfur carrier protein ThiS [Gammaproteobacteria bacterium]